MNATAESCKEIAVSWDEPIDASSDIEYYKVTSVPPTVGSCGLQACSVSATQTSFAMLEYGVSYSILVAACNCSGCGPDFTLHNVRSKHIPEAGNVST